MAEKASNVVLNFKMDGQVQYAKTIRDINAIMNAAAKEYRNHVAAMGKDADATKKLSAEKKKLEIQMEAAKQRTQMLRTQYEAMAKDSKTTTGQLAQMHGKLLDAERAEMALEDAMERVNAGLSEQAEESRKAEDALNKLESEAEKLESQTEKLTAEYELQVAQLGENASEAEKLKLQLEHLDKAHDLAGDQVKNFEQQLEMAKKQYGENSSEVDKYEIQLLEAKKAEQDLANEIKTTNTKLKEQEDVLANTSKKLKETGDKMKDVGKDLSMKVTAPIVAMGGLAANSAIEFESAFAGVRKTVDATEEEFAQLSDGIRDMSKNLPASAGEIAAVAEAAGQLGIQKENILGFTRTMIDLGESTNMSADTAATEFARFANIVNMSQKDFDKLGSVVVDLGNNLATTEGEIVSMAMRLAGAGAQIGLSEADIMALAGSLSSVGIEAEMGGSAISKAMIRMQVATSTGFDEVEKMLNFAGMSLREVEMMASHSGKAFGHLAEDMGMTKTELKALVNSGKDLENFSKISGMTAEEFKNAFEKDAIGALGAFINGLGGAEEAGESAINMLQEMGITEVRLRDALLRAGNASELFASSVELASNAWGENSALTKEAEQRYATAASQLAMFKNTLNDLGITIGNIIVPVLLDLVNMVKPVIEGFANMSERSQKVILVIAGIAAAIGPLLIITGMLLSSIGSIISFVTTALPIIKAFGVFLAGVSAPVWGIIAAIAAAIAIGILLWKNWDTIKAKTIEIWNAIVEKFTEVKDKVSEKISEMVANAVAKFNEFKEKLVAKMIEIKDSVVRFFTETIPTAFNNFVSFLSELPGRIMAFLTKLFLEDIPYAIGYGIGYMISTISEGITNMIEFFRELPGKVLLFLVLTIANIAIWAADMKKRAIAAGTEFLTNTIKFFKELPGKIWTFLTETITKVTTFVHSMKVKAVEAGITFVQNVINFIKELPGKIWAFLVNTISKMAQFVSDMKSKAKGAGKNAYDGIVDEVKKIPGKLKELGSDIITGLVNGVTNNIKKVANIAKKVASSFTKGFKDAMGIKSPSRVMFKDGQFTMEGLGLGIEDMVDYVVSKTAKVGRAITGAMENALSFDVPELNMTTVRQPSQFGADSSPAAGDNGLALAAINQLGKEIASNIGGASGDIAVHVYLDTRELNTQMAPGMSRTINSNNKIQARTLGVVAP
ncbi:phage tail tape measure protein [Neobacillus notoginsengisoli]|uniref:Phage tail tape measure protein n=1 Tax=Neobacillus notoginsengisoli TaxID=1578198 RepID=A0A417YR53_9BACI|nr:phage tail tape measure protein [Neobacillus notoginsengisoli]RHW37325.1 phage tail tape measure protein [Neobacillus notoginsengisoli]